MIDKKVINSYIKIEDLLEEFNFSSIKLIFSTAKNIIKSMFKSAFRKRGTKPWDIYKSATNDPKPELMVDYK